MGAGVSKARFAQEFQSKKEKYYRIAYSYVKREARGRNLRRWTVSVAAVFCAVFLCANVTPIYAYASRLPIIGTVVQVLAMATAPTAARGKRRRTHRRRSRRGGSRGRDGEILL